MRYLLAALAVTLGSAFTLATPAHADTAPGTAIGADGFSVLVGAADAPVQLEIFCEPQCPVCAHFEDASGDALSQRLAAGDLAVTYRWLTFLDGKRNNDTSARIANTLLLAADPGTPAPSYQGFVTEMYRAQNGSADAPSATQLATMAAHNGVSGMAIARIAIDLPAADTALMNSTNMTRLKQVNPDNPGTPTVYNLNTNDVIDAQESGWLDSLFVS
ncbi:thioredoxin domain-containing protein [Mycobacterium koreense]|uniref:Uncharacterized protein n=2 Tax=Mycolicibacillus koreensis TaxID=1069220 RepID=A0A7I7SF80_9MYCO|nr:thioredoxin domain-containing protein [Mycolicibacillus koreensis]MCV7248232.1 thioredoxin domain-containing protein [Mycolicibacillus koreensis]OSC33878.1 hypothetical protein B8W67_09185 [Mycolicibacillus koreensis]BBY55170.1 protein disulfide-isomerase [Mycolicibacillus koreensis]